MINSIITSTFFHVAECYIEGEIVKESDIQITESCTCCKNSYDTESAKSSRHGVRLWTQGETLAVERKWESSRSNTGTRYLFVFNYELLGKR